MDKLMNYPDEVRPVHTFNVPESLAASTGVKSVGMVELNALDELQAAKKAKGDAMRLAYELAKSALVEVNGEKLSAGDGSLESAWLRMNPKVRNLVLAAYGELHSPPDGSVDDFLKSRQVKV